MQLVKVTPEGAEPAVIVTEPPKPWRLVTATWVEPDAPELKSTGLVAEMLKPDTNVKVAVVEWDAVPGEPVAMIVTVKLPGEDEVQVKVAVVVPLAVRGTLGGMRAPQLRPVGRGVSDNDTLPAKFWTLVRVMVDMADEPTLTLAGDVAEIWKSPT